MSRATRSRWRIGLVVAAVCAGLGLAVSEPVVFLAGGLGVAHLAYSSLSDVPAAEDLVVERTVETTSPRPDDDDVTVTVAVHNVGEQYVPDARLVDGVPESVIVTEGTPRTSGPLEPDSTLQTEYTVRARRGTHEFAPAVATAHSLTGGAVREVRSDSETMTVRSAERAPALGEQTTGAVGRVETDEAGEGVAFHSVRTYERGDPASRIDWRRFAKTGDLSTVEYREERAATVVVVADVRPESDRVRALGESPASGLVREGATAVASGLCSNGDAVGVAIWGGEDAYLPPARTAGTARAIERLLDGDEVPEGLQSRVRAWSSSLFTRQLPDAAQIVLCSPLTDDRPVERAASWLAHGHDVTVLSPNPVPETAGGAVASRERRERTSRLRRAGAHVVEWSPEESLAVAVERGEVQS